MNLFLLLSFILIPISRSDPAFQDYPTPPPLSSCTKVDFTSYHRARNAESMIRSSNSDFSKPNFGGKYLLLRVPFMMGTDWLIADCESGKFIKEVLSDGEAEFKNTSFLIRMTRKNETNWVRFTGSEFIKTEEKVNSPNPGPSSSAPLASLEGQYESVFKSFPSKNLASSCVPLNFNSYFRAQQAKGQILKSNPNFSTPNFGGGFQLLKIELLFETIWVLADCKTGSFFNLFLAGEAHFKKDSDLVVMTESGKAPKLFLWKNPNFISKSDPTLKNSNAVENEVTKEQARVLITALPNPEHHSKIEFKAISCTQATPPGAPSCVLHQESAQGVLQEIPLSGESSSKIRPILEFYEIHASIELLRCSIEQESCILRSR